MTLNANVELYALVLARVSGLLLVAPGLSGTQIPLRMRGALALALTLPLAAALPGSSDVSLKPHEPGFLPLALGMDFLVGLGIGCAFSWSLSAAGMAGELAGLQMGLGVASTVDPTSGQGAMLTETMFMLAITTLFFALDGHHDTLRALRGSFDAIPPGGAHWNWQSPSHFVGQTALALSAGLRLALIIVAPLMLIAVTLALVSRVFPQANMYTLGYGATLLLGLVLLGSSGPALRHAVAESVRDGCRASAQWVQGFAQ